MQHISIPVFRIILRSIEHLPKADQKKALTKAYEDGAITENELTHAIQHLNLGSA